MIINICDDYQRLHLAGASSDRRQECTREIERPWSVHAWQTERSRNPITARFKTLSEAAYFVEQVTGEISQHWVTNGTHPKFDFQAFTGKHQARYKDTEQYTPVPYTVWTAARGLYQ